MSELVKITYIYENEFLGKECTSSFTLLENITTYELFLNLIEKSEVPFEVDRTWEVYEGKNFRKLIGTIKKLNDSDFDIKVIYDTSVLDLENKSVCLVLRE